MLTCYGSAGFVPLLLARVGLLSALVIAGADARDAARSRRQGGRAVARCCAPGFDVPPFIAITPEPSRTTGCAAKRATLLARAVAALGPGPFAVRSSGREEDGAAHSHAGQFLSLLDIPADGIEDAALKVWRSGSTETLRAYRASRGLDPAGGAPAVIVQRMVKARAAGVAFSADPVSGRRDRIIVSAIAGLGDRLVGGELDGDSYVLDRATGAPLDGAGRRRADDRRSRGAARRLPARSRRRAARRRTSNGRSRASVSILLQARPITTALRAAPVADPTQIIFDNSNIVESYPGLVSPLTYSFAQYVYARVYRSFVALLGVSRGRHPPARRGVREHARPHRRPRLLQSRQLVSRARAAAGLRHQPRPHGDHDGRRRAVAGRDRRQRSAHSPRADWALVREYGRVARVALGLTREAFRLRRTSRAFYARLDAALRTDAAALDAMPLSALAAEYRRIEADLLERWDAPLINDFLCMMAFGASRKLIERWAGAAGLELHNDIMIGQGDIISAEPAQRIARMGALAAGDADLRRGARARRPRGARHASRARRGKSRATSRNSATAAPRS